MRLGERVARLKAERTLKDVCKKAHSRSEQPLTNLNLEIPTLLMKILKKMDLHSKRDRSRDNADILIEPDAMGLSSFS
jgi:hypothetical protein